MFIPLSMRKITQLITCNRAHICTHSSNSLCGGTCRLEIIRAPNDDVYSGVFEFSSGKDFW